MLMPRREQAQMQEAMQELDACNAISLRYGLSLTMEQLQGLVKGRFEALEQSGRVEFGEGVLKKLVYAFCDSPYICQEEYQTTLLALQERFYYFKSQCLERIGDDALIHAMQLVFNTKAQGSLEYLEGYSLERLCRLARGCEWALEGETADGEEYDDDE